MFIGFLVVVGVIALYLFSTYNQFVTTKTRIKASIQEIGNQLKRQAELIPNLVEAAKGYLKHEKGIFEDLTSARKAILSSTEKGDLKKMMEAGEMVSKALTPIMALVESNPQIRGVEAVNPLMNELRDTSDKVMYARRTLIDLTADYNIKVVTFPSNIVAKLFKFEPEKGLEMAIGKEALSVSEEEEKTPKVKLD